MKTLLFKDPKCYKDLTKLVMRTNNSTEQNIMVLHLTPKIVVLI